ncbi:MAG: GNAT family N-acetyltransferase [Rhodocyclaceae bacterium]|nr:GNAT family N-acetyltransferase [Rhodocyclaceae bacterium]
MAPRQASEDNPDPERSSIDIANGFVAEAGGRIVGTCGYIIHNPGLAETASLAVDPSFKGGGVGYLLQKARLDEMRLRGIRIVRTETDRPDTIRWYVEKFGYRIVGTNPKKHDFSLPDVDHWTVLELNLLWHCTLYEHVQFCGAVKKSQPHSCYQSGYMSAMGFSIACENGAWILLPISK